MRGIEFPQSNIIFGKDQEQYLELPACILPNSDTGEVVFCWKLTWRERFKLLFTGKLWHQVLTFDAALQPQLLAVDSPFVSVMNEEASAS